MDVTRVQRWVISALTLTIAFVWAGGMVLGALFTVDQSRDGAQIGILVICSVIGVAAIIGVRTINELPWLTPWLLAGLVPAALGFWGLGFWGLAGLR